MEQKRLYPIGIQTFSEIREGNYVYIDKTEYVYGMTHSSPKYFFLSRPRRFGKSLLTSTLHSYFEGQKGLFEGLKIAELETDWIKYPVLHFDMSTAKHQDKNGLEQELNKKLTIYERIYGRNEEDVNVNQRLEGLIVRAHQQTGQKVVVLIDEYDAPLLDVVHEKENLPLLRQVMRNFYSPLKACDAHLRFVFFTGITKFSQLSVFSELNNITNISMLTNYAGICGITKQELTEQMSEDIALLAEKNDMHPTQMADTLKEYYDGYHFTWPSDDIFNPYSLMKAFELGQVKAYWFESGTPTYVIELLRKYGAMPSEVACTDVSENDFNIPIEQASNYMPMLYQAGYLTIKNYEKKLESYSLDVPNKEVRLGLMQSLISYYVIPDKSKANTALIVMARSIMRDDINGALEHLQTFLGTVPQCNDTNYEGHYQQMLYVIFSLFGNYCDVEVHTPDGRVDMVMRTATKLYLIELKINKSAKAAMDQIDLKQYDKRFALCGLPIVKVGINFDTDKHNITDWTIE